MRSGTFSIGVLGGLAEQGVLEKIDIISSVSGGSYANSWFLVQSHRVASETNGSTSMHELFKSYFVLSAIRDNDPEVEPLRRPDKADITTRRFQTYLEGHSYLLTKAQDSRYNDFVDDAIFTMELSVRTALWIPTIPLNAIANGVFRWSVNLNPWEAAYENGIERTFIKYPTDWYSVYDVEQPTFKELARSAENGDIPFFIINTTAAYGGSLEWLRNASTAGFNSDLASVVYEFTPIAYGNTAFGYCDYQDGVERETYGVGCHPAKSPKLSEAVAISGAAVDALKLTNNPAVDTVVDAIADGTNLSLGRYITNPRVAPSTRILHKPWPWPLYLALNQKYDEHRDSVYLSDGGHSENLGMYALIKRRVKNIIAIDAEHEATSAGDQKLAVFDALQRLRCHIRKEEGLSFYKVDGQVTIPDDFLKADACQTFNREQIGFDFTSSNPYFRFDICPVQGCTADNQIRVLYVKLSVDVAAMPPNSSWTKILKGCDGENDYSCEAVRLYLQGISSCQKKLIGECDRFPQVSTADINYPRVQVNGHRGLGYSIGRRITVTEEGPAGRPFTPWKLEQAQPASRLSQ